MNIFSLVKLSIEGQAAYLQFAKDFGVKAGMVPDILINDIEEEQAEALPDGRLRIWANLPRGGEMCQVFIPPHQWEYR